MHAKIYWNLESRQHKINEYSISKIRQIYAGVTLPISEVSD